MLQSKDGQQLHDHTFIGNGCPNEWVNDPPTYGGSGTSCTTKIVKDGNDEDQSIGVLYTFQAATSGSGGTIKTDNEVSPDTFCPLGWQVPYGGTGGDYYDKSKSWYYLLTEYSIPFNDGNASSAQKVKSYPFSYISSGHFNLTNGYLYNQSISGLYFSTTASGDYDAYRYVITTGKVRTLEISNKAYALAVRCVPSLIDGTVEGTNIEQIDTNHSHDHTYYGNGCSKDWASGGSEKSCETKIAETTDGESQYIGVYYHFEAASSGSGASVSTDNTNVPDSFCPLGWQLPYGGTGGDYYNKSKSWMYLFNSYSDLDFPSDKRLTRKYPISHIGSGDYYWANGRLFYMWKDSTWGGSIMLWTQTNRTANVVYTLNNTNLNVYDPKNFGYSVRCF